VPPAGFEPALPPPEAGATGRLELPWLLRGTAGVSSVAVVGSVRRVFVPRSAPRPDVEPNRSHPETATVVRGAPDITAGGGLSGRRVGQCACPRARSTVASGWPRSLRSRTWPPGCAPGTTSSPPARPPQGKQQGTKTPRPGPVVTGKWLHASVTDDNPAAVSAMFDEAERRDPTTNGPGSPSSTATASRSTPPSPRPPPARSRSPSSSTACTCWSTYGTPSGRSSARLD
jgi:hypothetical protein